MNNFAVLSAYFVAGAIFGGLYFGALWVTVGRLAGSRSPARTLMFSFIFRLGFLLLVLFFALRSSDAVQILVSLLGFILVRALMILDPFKNPGSLRLQNPGKQSGVKQTSGDKAQ